MEFDFNPAIHSFLGMTAVIHSAPMRQLMRTVERTGKSNATVLITGETGSGKELIARAIHHHSLRCAKPLIDVNCAAIPDHLLESELFGYEKGAFSGAESTKQGLFELANGGSLFLDEVGELDLKMQVKLLRVLDGTPYYRLGGTRKVAVDVRVIAATDVDLREAVERGNFRRDLFHRLDQARLEVPPLRQRSDDVEALAGFFLDKEAPGMRFAAEALRVMKCYSWPGNVRELRNVVVKSALQAESNEITAGDLPRQIWEPAPARSTVPTGSKTLDAMEAQAILDALSETGGRQDRAAQILGISRRTLIRKLKSYGSPDSNADQGTATPVEACTTAEVA